MNKICIFDLCCSRLYQRAKWYRMYHDFNAVSPCARFHGAANLGNSSAALARARKVMGFAFCIPVDDGASIQILSCGTSELGVPVGAETAPFLPAIGSGALIHVS